MEKKIQGNGLVKYIIEEMGKFDKAARDLGTYINRQIYREALHDEFFELKSKSKNIQPNNILYHVSTKVGEVGVYTDWYKNIVAEYRLNRIYSLYGISLIDYMNLPQHILETIRDDAVQTAQKERQAASEGARDFLRTNSQTMPDIDRYDKLKF